MSLFSNKPTAILYLRRQDAVLITKSSSTRMSIPVEVAYNLEVRDATTLTDIVAQFLNEHKVRGQQMLLILDNEIVFQKQLSGATDTQAALKDFTSKVPFEPDTKQLIETHQKDQTTFYGVNRSWYEAIATGIRQNNKLKAIVPAFAYGLQEGKKIDRSTITAFFQNTKIPREANFLIKA